MKASGEPETIVAELPTDHHWTRDIVFSPDGKTLYRLGRLRLEHRRAGRWHGDGTARLHREPSARRDLGRGGEPRRRARLRSRRQEPARLRHRPSQLLRHDHPAGDRSALVRRQRARRARRQSCRPTTPRTVKEGAFYGWPWYYIGSNEDPRLQGQAPRPRRQGDRAGRALPGAFGAAQHHVLRRRRVSRPTTRAMPSLPCTARGTATTAPATRSCACSSTDGKPTGEYQDFMTGFVLRRSVGLGPPGGCRRGEGRLAARQRRRQRHDLAGDGREEGGVELNVERRILRLNRSLNAGDGRLRAAVASRIPSGRALQRLVGGERGFARAGDDDLQHLVLVGVA